MTSSYIMYCFVVGSNNSDQLQFLL